MKGTFTERPKKAKEEKKKKKAKDAKVSFKLLVGDLRSVDSQFSLSKINVIEYCFQKAQPAPTAAPPVNPVMGFGMPMQPPSKFTVYTDDGILHY